jgi:hypothetical protein
MPNIVYVLTNEAMPGLVKIGRTDAESVKERISSLNRSSAIPRPFICHFAAEVEDGPHVEKSLHRLFSKHRINKDREFFEIAPEIVVLAIEIDNRSKEVTPGKDEQKSDEQFEGVKIRRTRINLDALGIKVGTELTFSRDENIKAIVANDDMVDYGGEIMSLSLAAKKLLNYSCSGPLYWKFEGELLDERRRRMESEQFDDSTEDLD